MKKGPLVLIFSSLSLGVGVLIGRRFNKNIPNSDGTVTCQPTSSDDFAEAKEEMILYLKDLLHGSSEMKYSSSENKEAFSLIINKVICTIDGAKTLDDLLSANMIYTYIACNVKGNITSKTIVDLIDVVRCL